MQPGNTALQAQLTALEHPPQDAGATSGKAATPAPAEGAAPEAPAALPICGISP
jgi:hypothetical protein